MMGALISGERLIQHLCQFRTTLVRRQNFRHSGRTGFSARCECALIECKPAVGQVYVSAGTERRTSATTGRSRPGGAPPTWRGTRQWRNTWADMPNTSGHDAPPRRVLRRGGQSGGRCHDKGGDRGQVRRARSRQGSFGTERRLQRTLWQEDSPGQTIDRTCASPRTRKV
jgi:hypothetical protein